MKTENFLKYSDLQLNERRIRTIIRWYYNPNSTVIELQIRVFQKTFNLHFYLYSTMRLLNIAPLKHLIKQILYLQYLLCW